MTVGRPIRIGIGDPFLEHDLRGAQHALVLALGIDHALGVGLGRVRKAAS